MEIDFTKKFNVGLTLKTTLRAAERFFSQYGKYINEVYFSMPLGDRFHTRKAIRSQLSKKSSVKKFWRLLSVIKRCGIKLEMVLNTNTLTDEDIVESRRLLDEHGIDLDSVCCMDMYYDSVKRVFPDKPLICSYNNVFHSQKDIERISNAYDSYVLGGALIRDEGAFRHVKQEKHAKVVLLLNNGCSFNCSGCCAAQNCKPVFLKNLQKHSLDYLYALQSVFPAELYDGSICLDNVDYFKISNRSSGLKYLKKCLDSYMTNRVRKYIRFNFYNYALWGRMGQFWPRFIKLRYKKILAHKAEILGHELKVR